MKNFVIFGMVISLQGEVCRTGLSVSIGATVAALPKFFETNYCEVFKQSFLDSSRPEWTRVICIKLS